MVSPDIPTDRPLEKHEIEALVARAILKWHGQNAGSFQPEAFASPHNLGNTLGLRGDDIQKFSDLNRSEEYRQIYNEFIHKLISLGILIRGWEENAPGFYKVYQDGLEKLQDVAQLFQSESVPCRRPPRRTSTRR